MMRKLKGVLRIGVQNAVEYRFVIIFWMSIHLMTFTVIYSLWRAIFETQAQIQNYTLPMMVTYYIVGGIIRHLSVSYFEYAIDWDVRNGLMSSHLVKPFSYPLLRILTSVAWHATQAVLTFLVYGLIILAVRDIFVAPDSLLAIGFILINLVLSTLIWAFISCLFGFASFWLTDASLLFNFKDMITMVLSGYVIPVDLLPEALQKIIFMLPFQYLVYFPVNIYLGRLETPEIIQGLLMQTVWVFILWGMMRLVWSRGIRRFEAVGI